MSEDKQENKTHQIIKRHIGMERSMWKLACDRRKEMKEKTELITLGDTNKLHRHKESINRH